MLCILIGSLGYAHSTVSNLDLLRVNPDSLSKSIAINKVTKDLNDANIVKVPNAKPKATNVDALVGYYFTSDYSDAVTISRRYVVSITKNADNTLSVTNLLGAGQTVVATYNDTEKTLSISPQVTYVNSTYGNFYCCPVDFTANKYYPKSNIIATVDDNNTIHMPGWGVFVLEGENAGLQIVNRKSEMHKTNATMTDFSLSLTGDNAKRSYPVLYTRENPSTISIMNFYNTGRDILVKVDSVGNAAVPIQTVAISGTTNFYNYSITSYTSPTSLKLSSDDVKAVFVNDSIKINSWALSKSTSVSGIYEVLEKSIIVVPEQFSTYSNQLTLKGTGSIDDPYLIGSASDMENLSLVVNKNSEYIVNKVVFAGKYFKQTQDIDMSSVANHDPVGTADTATFGGIYDGDNHIISNLNVNRRNDFNTGLFGVIAEGGAVKNLQFVNPVLQSDRTQVGVVAGKSYGIVDNISVTNGLISNPVLYVGGVIGMNYGSVTNSHFSGNIVAQSIVGGVIGACYGKVDNVWSDATISTTIKQSTVGGVVGSASRAGTSIANSYFTGSITDGVGGSSVGGVLGYGYLISVKGCWNGGNIASVATSSGDLGQAGGIVGKLIGGTIDNCYNSGTVNGLATAEAGGLIGSAIKGATGSANASDAPIIKNSLTTSLLLTGSKKDGCELVGAVTDQIDMTNCYFDNQVAFIRSLTNGLSTLDLTKAEGISGFDNTVWTFEAGKYPKLTKFATNEKMILASTPFFLSDRETVRKVRSSFTIDSSNDVSWKMFHNMSYGEQGNGLKINGNNVEFIATKIVSDTLIAFKGNLFKFYVLKVVPDEFDGKGTAQEPYLVKTLNDLNKIDNAINYELYDFKSVYFKVANDIDMSSDTPFIGIAKRGIDYAFNGTFDGSGYKIKNWKLNRVLDAEGNYIDQTHNSMAGLFIYLGEYGEVKNVTIDSSCDVMAGSVVGGAVSYNLGKVSNCKNYAKISGAYRSIGGVVGYNDVSGKITGCYNNGKVTTGTIDAGGIVGYNYGIVSGSQNDGEVSARCITTYTTDSTKIYGAGGIVGHNYGIISNVLNQGHIAGAIRNGGIAGSMESASKVEYAINTGVIDPGYNSVYHGALCGYNYSKADSLKAVYYDSQLSTDVAAQNKAVANVSGITTSELISGKALDGFDASVWKFDAGLYPVIAQFVDEPASKLYSNSYIKFATGTRNDTRFSSTKSSKIVSSEGSAVSLAKGINFSIDKNILNVTLPQTGLATDTITFALGDYKKIYPLAAMPVLLAKGDGTKENPWIIETAEDMDKIAKYSISYSATFEGEFFTVLNNIDFKNFNYTPIASDGTTSFQGTFNGNDKVLSNLVYSNNDSKLGKYKGLFGQVGDKATISNLTMDKTCSVEGDQYIGGFAGSTAGNMINCKNYATVKTTDLGFVAGIAGTAYAGATFKKCENYGQVTSANGQGAGIVGSTDESVDVDSCYNAGVINAKYSVGGIVGSSKATINNCRNYGDITSTSYYSGGITGYQAFNTTIRNCENHGFILASTYGAAGIVGCYFSIGSVDNCINYGNVMTGTIQSGGIVGLFSKGNSSVSNSINRGEIVATTSTSGGIVGATTAGTDAEQGAIRNCVNYADVTSIKTTAGGIVGDLKAKVNVINCDNRGAVSGESLVGGIAGSLAGAVDSCYNQGGVSGDFSLGGIAGTATGSIKNCCNLAKVESALTSATTSYNVGGILGTGKAILENVYNINEVTGYKQVGGIVGLPVKGTSSAVGTNINYAYNAGKITCSYENSKANCGNIVGGNVSSYVKYSNVYYDSQASSSTFDNDSVATYKPTPTSLLINAGDMLGTQWTCRTGCYPVLSCFSDSSAVMLYSSAVILDDNDFMDNVTKAFTIGAPDGVVWTSSNNLKIEGNNVIPINVSAGETATLTATLDNLSKVFKITLTKEGGAESPEADKEVLSTIYYTPNGVAYSSPVNGVNIKKVTYKDGSVNITKMVIRDAE